MKNEISMLKVKSSNIFSIGYDKDFLLLRIKFRTGGLYEYKGVPESIFTSFLNAKSKGKFFYAYIKNNYKCLEIHDKPQIFQSFNSIRNYIASDISERIIEPPIEWVTCRICGEQLENGTCRKCVSKDNV